MIYRIHQSILWGILQGIPAGILQGTCHGILYCRGWDIFMGLYLGL